VKYSDKKKPGSAVGFDRKSDPTYFRRIHPPSFPTSREKVLVSPVPSKGVQHTELFYQIKQD
jgi:hypothetical protein